MSRADVPAPIENLEDVLRRVHDVSTLPQVALRVLQITSDPEANIMTLVKVIEGDPPLASKVLRTVNSAAYAVHSVITNLSQAVSYLGFNQVRNLALAVSVSKIFKNDQEVGTYRRTLLWRHLVAVGLCARLIAARSRFVNFEDAFLAGLLHDLGIILEDQYVHQRFCMMIESLKPHSNLLEAEQEILGFDHTKIAHRVAKRWKFPEVVLAAMRFHHSPGEYSGQGAEIVGCVHLANVLCTAKGISSVGLPLVKPDLDVVQRLRLGKDDIKVLVADLDDEIAKNQVLFEVQ